MLGLTIFLDAGILKYNKLNIFSSTHKRMAWNSFSGRPWDIRSPTELIITIACVLLFYENLVHLMVVLTSSCSRSACAMASRRWQSGIIILDSCNTSIWKHTETASVPSPPLLIRKPLPLLLLPAFITGLHKSQHITEHVFSKLWPLIWTARQSVFTGWIVL